MIKVNHVISHMKISRWHEDEKGSAQVESAYFQLRKEGEDVNDFGNDCCVVYELIENESCVRP